MRKMENKQLSIHKQMYNIYIYINIVVTHMFVKKNLGWLDHQKSIAIIISEFDRSANIWRHTFCGWNIKQNNSWFPVLKGDCSSPAYLNPTYHPSLMCISHHIPLPSPNIWWNQHVWDIYIYIYPYILIYILYPYIRPSLATYTVCRSIPSHPAWTSLKTVGSQRFFWGDFPHQPAMPRSLTSFLMQFLLCIPHIFHIFPP